MNWQSPRAIYLMQSWLPALKSICCSSKHSKSTCELFSTDLRLTFIYLISQSVTAITHSCLADVLFEVPVSQLMVRFYTLELGRGGVSGRLTKLQRRSGRGGLAMTDCSLRNLLRDLKKVPSSFWEDSCMAAYSSFRKQALSKELVRFSNQARCSLMRVRAHPLAVLSLSSTSSSSCEQGSRQLRMSCRICWFFLSAASFSAQARSMRSRLWQTARLSSESFFITFSTSSRCSCQTSCRLLRITCSTSTQHRSSSSLALAFPTNSEKYWMKVSSEQTAVRWAWSLRMQLLQRRECVEHPLLRQRKDSGCLCRLQSLSLSWKFAIIILLALLNDFICTSTSHQQHFFPSLLRERSSHVFISQGLRVLHLTDNIIGMLVQPQTALSSLKKIAQVCQTGSSFTCSVMGVVVDMTRPLYRQRDKDYIVEVKIVDELVNDCEVFGVMVKYCSVYLFSKERKELEVCNQIGQILLLDSFTFSIWNEIKLETKYRSTIEKLYTFDHSQGNLSLFNFLSRTAREPSDARSQDVLFRAERLAEWFGSYFCERFRPTLGISLVNNYCVMAEPFNMILQRWEGGVEELPQKPVNHHLALTDAHGNRFIIDRDCLPTRLPASQFFFVRNIRHIGNFYEILLTETGYVLGLPMDKAGHYQREMNYCAISRFNERFLLRNHKTCNLSKVNYVCPKTTPLLELLNQADLYENKFSTKEELRMEDLYMVECVAVNFQGRLHMFHSELQMIADDDYVNSLNDDERTELIQKGILEYLYEGVIGVIDRSSECTGRLLYVHLFTNEKRARFFEGAVIEQLNKKAGLPKEKNTQEEERVTEEIESKLKKLIEKSDFTNTVSMLLEPIKSDVLIYRLTNTIFL